MVELFPFSQLSALRSFFKRSEVRISTVYNVLYNVVTDGYIFIFCSVIPSAVIVLRAIEFFSTWRFEVFLLHYRLEALYGEGRGGTNISVGPGRQVEGEGVLMWERMVDYGLSLPRGQSILVPVFIRRGSVLPGRCLGNVGRFQIQMQSLRSRSFRGGI